MYSDYESSNERTLWTGVGNQSQNPRDPGKSRDFRDWDWDLGFILKIWDLGLGFGIQFQNLGFGIGIWDLFSESGIWDWDLGFVFFWANLSKSEIGIGIWFLKSGILDWDLGFINTKSQIADPSESPHPRAVARPFRPLTRSAHYHSPIRGNVSFTFFPNRFCLFESQAS